MTTINTLAMLMQASSEATDKAQEHQIAHAANPAQPGRRCSLNVATQTAAPDSDTDVAEPEPRRRSKGGITWDTYQIFHLHLLPYKRYCIARPGSQRGQGNPVNLQGQGQIPPSSPAHC